MLTPAFELSQDKEFLTIIIKASFAKISDTEIFVEETDFKFFSKPYFLRLSLPGNIIEDGREKADYDSDKGVFTLKFPKEVPGEHFEGLDMITKLLAPKGKASAAPPLIEVIGTDDTVETTDGGTADQHTGDDDQEEEEEEEYDWQVIQTPYTEQPIIDGAPKYGFANQKSGIFKRLQEELCGVVDCPDPDTVSVAQRRQQRVDAECAKFDEDHYIGDLYEDEMIQPLLSYRPMWLEEYDVVQQGTPIHLAVELTDEEKDMMRKFPNKEYVLDQSEETAAYLGLVDIIFAYAYNNRTTEGENCVESGWTVSKISATLSWLEVYENTRDVVVSCIRRSLCYPLYRHWTLSLAVLRDVIHIFKLGRRRLLRCLLEVRGLLLDQESRYILNDLYITDYCVWIQAASNKRLESLAEALEKVVITKDDVGFELEEAERIAQIAMQDSSDDEVEDVAHQISTMNMNKKKCDRDSDYGSTHSETDTTETDVTSDDEDDTDSDDDVDDDDDVKNANTESDITNFSADVSEHLKHGDAKLKSDSFKLSDNSRSDILEETKSNIETKTENTSKDLKPDMAAEGPKRCKPLIVEIE